MASEVRPGVGAPESSVVGELLEEIQSAVKPGYASIDVVRALCLALAAELACENANREQKLDLVIAALRRDFKVAAEISDRIVGRSKPS